MKIEIEVNEQVLANALSDAKIAVTQSQLQQYVDETITALQKQVAGLEEKIKLLSNLSDLAVALALVTQNNEPTIQTIVEKVDPTIEHALDAIKYPDVTVQLTDVDGNAFGILGAVGAAMKSAGLSGEQVAEYRTDATAGDYNHLLQTTMAYVKVE